MQLFASRIASFFFFFNDTATTEIYTLSLHDALPISRRSPRTCRAGCPAPCRARAPPRARRVSRTRRQRDRKSTRLNSSHLVISYAVFCLKKKKEHSVSSVAHDDVHPSSFCLWLRHCC